MIDIGWMTQNGPWENFSQGQVIPCPGAFGDSEKAMYILLAGKIDITGSDNGGPQAASLHPGDVFGGDEYFTGKTRYVYTAAVDSVAYVISESTFYELSRSKPDIVFEVLRAAYTPPGRHVTQATPTAQATSAAQAVPAVQATPTAQVAPTAQAAPAVQAAPTAQAAPATQAAPTAQAAPAVQATPPAQTAPAVQAQSAAKTITPEPKAARPVSGKIFPEGHKSYPGLTKPDYAKLVYPKDYTCPYCKKKFNDFRIFGSKLYESAPMRYDLRRFYRDFQPAWYDIVVCRHCYFSTVHGFYTEPKPFLKQKVENELAVISESIDLDFDSERDIDFVFTSHYLALLCANGYLSYANPLRAKIWGNISWLYEDVSDAEMERFAAEKAALAYENVYAGTAMTPVQEQTTCLSIVGMQLRAGIDRNLKKFLYQVKTTKMGEKAYVKMAEDLMDEMRESAQ